MPVGRFLFGPLLYRNPCLSSSLLRCDRAMFFIGNFIIFVEKCQPRFLNSLFLKPRGAKLSYSRNRRETPNARLLWNQQRDKGDLRRFLFRLSESTVVVVQMRTFSLASVMIV